MIPLDNKVDKDITIVSQILYKFVVVSNLRDKALAADDKKSDFERVNGQLVAVGPFGNLLGISEELRDIALEVRQSRVNENLKIVRVDSVF